MYHRVTGDTSLELDLPFEVFRQQMQWLAENATVVSLDQALEGLDDNVADSPGNQKTGNFVITFDDAYSDFYDKAFPLLAELQFPATLYVPTGFIDNPDGPPISRNIVDAERLQPCTWDMLKDLAASPLITLGAHTVSHRELPSLSDEEILEELSNCDARLEELTGAAPRHFAYPRGVWDERVEKLVAPRYRSVAIAGVGEGPMSASRLPRIPILRSDGMRWFQHRIHGRLDLERRMVGKIKSWLRR